jgi:phosphoglycerate kinase
MFKLPKLKDLDVSGKRVLLRLDLDTEPDSNDLRIKSSFDTLDYLKSKNAQILIIAHRGRPEGKAQESLSLAPFQKIFDKWGAKVEENLRFNSGEEANDEKFAAELASKADVYVNEAFGASHREHASVVSLPKLLPHGVGLRFAEEVENLSKLLNNPPKPFITLLSGIKKDKLDYLEGLKALSDKVLIGGRLPEFLGDNTVSVRSYDSQEKVIIGNLSMDKEDLTLNTIERFEEEVSQAKTILVCGPLGKFEEEGHRQATERVFKKIAETDAFKVAGGGDTLKAIDLLNLEDKFNWVSVGGGAMLEFLTKGTLPGIDALLN